MRRRQAVAHAQEHLEVSQRRACKALNQPRATQRYQSDRPERDSDLVLAIREIAAKHPRWGYRRVHARLRNLGWAINLKRVHRLWKLHGLKVPKRTRKRRRIGNGEGGASRQRASHRGEVWSYDFVMDQTSDGKRLKYLAIVDDHSRENIALEVERSMTADGVVTVLERAIQEYGAPQYLRSDNGPEFVAQRLRAWVEEMGFATIYIEPGAPWENCFAESFNSKLRDEHLNLEEFGSLAEAKVLANDWRKLYNQERPHSSLGGQPPAAAALSAAPLRPTASTPHR